MHPCHHGAEIGGGEAASGQFNWRRAR